MARAKPLVITLSAREVVAAGEAFRERVEALRDPSAALDEIASLRARREPLVLRAAVAGRRRT